MVKFLSKFTQKVNRINGMIEGFERLFPGSMEQFMDDLYEAHELTVEEEPMRFFDYLDRLIEFEIVGKGKNKRLTQSWDDDVRIWNPTSKKWEEEDNDD